MNKQPELPKSVLTASLVKSALCGAGIALTLMIIFLLGVKHPNPAWGKLWFIRPLIVISLAGAGGGSIFYYMYWLTNSGGWKRIVAMIFSFIAYIIALWLGTVLGLNGTLWN